MSDLNQLSVKVKKERIHCYNNKVVFLIILVGLIYLAKLKGKIKIDFSNVRCEIIQKIATVEIWCNCAEISRVKLEGYEKVWYFHCVNLCTVLAYIGLKFQNFNHSKNIWKLDLVWKFLTVMRIYFESVKVFKKLVQIKLFKLENRFEQTYYRA